MTGKAQNAIGLITTLGATAVAKKVVDATWKMGAGRKPPADPTDPDTEIREALLLAVLTGAAVGVARLLVTRKVEERARRKAARRALGR